MADALPHAGGRKPTLSEKARSCVRQIIKEKNDLTLDEVCRRVKKGAMPLWSYTLLHREAVITPADVTTLCEWSEQARKELRQRE